MSKPNSLQNNIWLLLLIGFAIAATSYVLFPYSLSFLTRIVITIILVLSLDLILGYGGIATLGQAAMYGTGAYAAGLFAVHISQDPILGLIAGALAGVLIALISGLLLMRSKGLVLLMLTIAVAQVLYEIANSARSITGGADGLSDIVMKPLFGYFEFDFIGQTAYWYSIVILALVFLLLKILTNSAFGLSIKGIHESPERMRAIGNPVYWRLVTVYSIGGGIAGLAGALTAQITELVSLEVFTFTVSAEAVIMLILGGTGRLYGSVIGVIIFMVFHHIAASVDPFNWLFAIGGLLLAVVFFLPKGLMSLPSSIKIFLERVKP